MTRITEDELAAGCLALHQARAIVGILESNLEGMEDLEGRMETMLDLAQSKIADGVAVLESVLKNTASKIS